jgi:hypothetical protein
MLEFWPKIRNRQIDPERGQFRPDQEINLTCVGQRFFIQYDVHIKYEYTIHDAISLRTTFLTADITIHADWQLCCSQGRQSVTSGVDTVEKAPPSLCTYGVWPLEMMLKNLRCDIEWILVAAVLQCETEWNIVIASQRRAPCRIPLEYRVRAVPFSP